jgi:hypothetical protein
MIFLGEFRVRSLDCFRVGFWVDPENCVVILELTGEWG